MSESTSEVPIHVETAFKGPFLPAINHLLRASRDLAEATKSPATGAIAGFSLPFAEAEGPREGEKVLIIRNAGDLGATLPSPAAMRTRLIGISSLEGPFLIELLGIPTRVNDRIYHTARASKKENIQSLVEEQRESFRPVTGIRGTKEVAFHLAYHFSLGLENIRRRRISLPDSITNLARHCKDLNAIYNSDETDPKILLKELMESLTPSSTNP